MDVVQVCCLLCRCHCCDLVVAVAVVVVLLPPSFCIGGEGGIGRREACLPSWQIPLRRPRVVVAYRTRAPLRREYSTST